MLRCALSGQVPKTAVATPQGIIYDKDTIESYIRQNPVCPVTGRPLALADLILIQTNIPETHAQTNRSLSFTDYLFSIQNQWNSMQTELYEMRRKLRACEREKALALYETEAAKRVIARILANEQEKIVIHPISNQKIEEGTFSSFIKDVSHQYFVKLNFQNDFHNQFFSPSTNILQGFASYRLYHITSVLGGSGEFTCIDQSVDSKLLIGTSEGTIVIYDVYTRSVIHQIQAGSSPITSIRGTQDYSFIATDSEGNIYFYNNYSDDSHSAMLETHNYILNIFFHPQFHHIIVIYKNGFDVIQINNKEKVIHFEVPREISKSSIHPGGRYLAISFVDLPIISLYDLSSEQLYLCDIDTESEIYDLHFSPNTLHISASTSNGMFFAVPSSLSDEITADFQTFSFVFPTKSHCWHSNGVIIASFGESESHVFMITDPVNINVSESVKFPIQSRPTSSLFGNSSYFITAIGPQDELQIFI